MYGLSSKLWLQSQVFTRNCSRYSNINSLGLLKRNVAPFNSARLTGNYTNARPNPKTTTSRWSKYAAAGGVAIAVCVTAAIANSISHRHQNIVFAATQDKQSKLSIKIYQYQNCPFCCKVRAFLNYYNIPYEIIEVNPLTRSEIKFSKYRKVPIVIANDVQVHLLMSHLIIALILTCNMVDKRLSLFPWYASSLLLIYAWWISVSLQSMNSLQINMINLIISNHDTSN